MERTCIRVTAGLLLSVIGVAAAPSDGVAVCWPPRLLREAPRLPFHQPPSPPDCLRDRGFARADCAPGERDAYRWRVDGYLAELEDFVRESDAFARAADDFARQAGLYARCQADELAIR